MRAPEVAQALRHVFDPELGIDVVSLGLVYGIAVEGDAAVVTMTTTSPSCPLGSVIVESAEAVLHQSFPGADLAVVTTFEPPWQVEMADDNARMILGLPPRSPTGAGSASPGRG